MDDPHSVLSTPLQIMQEAALPRYHDALQRWEEEKERQRDEFTITDKNLTESQGVPIDKVLPQIQSDIFDRSSSTYSPFVLLQEPVAAPVRKVPPLRKYKVVLICCICLMKKYSFIDIH